MTATGTPSSSGCDPLIRRAGPADIEIIAALQAVCFDDPWSRDSVGRLISAPGSLTQLALVRGENRTEAAGIAPAGFALWRSIVPEAELLLLGVVPNMRRGGLGRRLIDAGVAVLRTLNVSELYLEVAESNTAAIALYHRTGFRVAGCRPDYYRGHTSVERTALVMACRCDS